ncbi:MAG TPA: 30S ribosomal protein S6e [Candidatus Thermoplasmatota archaeon]|jgi:small subunit ribosomal protein S6e|nr:30S ribosomal protein S6e [Candidatus Thermoplasmatota archaeon]
MVEFRVVVSDPKDGKSVQVNVTGQHANVLVRKKIGDEIDGMFCGLPGYKLKITGGSDKDGFAMRPEVPSSGRKRILVSRSLGYKPNRRMIRKKRTFRTTGNRRKKTFRGNEISPDTIQINTKVTTRGPKSLAELAPKKEEKK